MENNPYVAPVATPCGSESLLESANNAERIRRQHFRQEAVVKSIAIFYFYVGAVEG